MPETKGKNKMKTQEMDVTPVMAARFLQKNEGNRKVKVNWLKQLTEMMERARSKAGRFMKADSALA